MKKLVLSAAVLLGSLSTFAAIAPVQNSVEKVITIANEYIEIKVEELPVAVTDALKVAYPDAVISKAYKNENNEYRIDIITGDQQGSLFSDANGKWLPQ
ncbi:hypothetical protein HNQ02_003227 [Flavobacterium sp. 7E]|uniref:hypothetical protein n=1 Tax=unclassified Flavobacterium TaxID=196869 RepID=UPI00156DE688|nr:MULTISPECIES: hypothetical protein [unclassified Flavobacterium]MBE0390990.1 hypothetical protein [Flavobacterium sp. PL002]NRS90289.1 hypothetical protein [Flavobacterium sp. 7E]